MSKNQKAVINLHENGAQESKIEAIKQLIFGENIQAYDSEFEALKKDILQKKKALEKLMQEVGDELRESIDGLSTDLNIRISELEQRLEDRIEHLDEKNVDKQTLGKMLIELGEKVSKK